MYAGKWGVRYRAAINSWVNDVYIHCTQRYSFCLSDTHTGKGSSSRLGNIITHSAYIQMWLHKSQLFPEIRDHDFLSSNSTITAYLLYVFSLEVETLILILSILLPKWHTRPSPCTAARCVETKFQLTQSTQNMVLDSLVGIFEKEVRLFSSPPFWNADVMAGV